MTQTNQQILLDSITMVDLTVVNEQLQNQVEILRGQIQMYSERAERAEQRNQFATNTLRNIGYKGMSYNNVSKANDELDRLNKLVAMGTHMELFQKTIKENAMVSQAWDDFMMALRLTGFDGTNGE